MVEGGVEALRKAGEKAEGGKEGLRSRDRVSLKTNVYSTVEAVFHSTDLMSVTIVSVTYNVLHHTTPYLTLPYLTHTTTVNMPYLTLLLLTCLTTLLQEYRVTMAHHNSTAPCNCN